MLDKIVDPIRNNVSGQAAKEVVAAVSGFHRIQATPGYRDAANYVCQWLKTAGLEAEVEQYPASSGPRFWEWRSFQEWSCRSASLELVEPDARALVLADFRDSKLSLIQRSAPSNGEAEIVVVEGGTSESDYDGLDVKGKLVLTSSTADQVRQLAVDEFGAIGVLFDGMASAPPVREAMDLPDSRQYTSFWWTDQGEPNSFGFVLTPRQGAKLRAQIKKQLSAGGPRPRARFHVDSSFRDGTFEVVSARIRGQGHGAVVVVSHLCHPQPSANDNGSGVAANMESARVLQKLIDSGALPPPERDILFLWLPEMTGSFAYLSRHEEEIPSMVAGVNLDMVGEDQDQTGSTMVIERPPDAAASFVVDLLERIREETFDNSGKISGKDRFPMFRYTTSTFTGGSDHYVFSDPTVGVPMAMLNQWPDKFYHTSSDTIDKVSADSLGRAAVMAASFAYFVATAGKRETVWLGHEMMTRYRARTARYTQVAAESALTGQSPNAELKVRLTYELSKFEQSLLTLARLWSDSAGLADRLADLARQHVVAELSRAEEMLQLCGSELLSAEPGPDINEWELRGLKLIPRRLYRGPAAQWRQKLERPERIRWDDLTKDLSHGGFTLLTLAEYWMDGKRSVSTILDLIELEIGIRESELVVRFVDTLAELHMIELAGD